MLFSWDLKQPADKSSPYNCCTPDSYPLRLDWTDKTVKEVPFFCQCQRKIKAAQCLHIARCMRVLHINFFLSSTVLVLTLWLHFDSRDEDGEDWRCGIGGGYHRHVAQWTVLRGLSDTELVTSFRFVEQPRRCHSDVWNSGAKVFCKGIISSGNGTQLNEINVRKLRRVQFDVRGVAVSQLQRTSFPFRSGDF